MTKTVVILFILLIAAIGFSAYWQSGDAGAAFATDLSIQKCKDPNVSAVFICSGNVVKVISSNFDEGIVFYKPEGRVVYCLEVNPTDMGAECVQLLGPNLCSPNSVCPPQNGSNVITQPVQPEANQTPVSPSNVNQDNGTPLNDSSSGTPKDEKTGIGSDIYVYGIIVVGMIVIAMLNYIYFKTRGTGTN